LRVLGFTRGEVGAVLVGELVVLTLAALPIGCCSDLVSPAASCRPSTPRPFGCRLVLTTSNYAFAVLVVAIASTLSALFAARKIAESTS